jgi:RNA polymerase-binding transcription factor DksA
MPDLHDAVQELEQRERDAIVANRVQQNAQGLTHCERADCREPIDAARTRLGARLCMDCQHEREAQQAHFAQWARR